MKGEIKIKQMGRKANVIYSVKRVVTGVQDCNLVQRRDVAQS